MTPPDSSIVLLAVLLDLSIGDPYWLPHPVVGIGRLITRLDKTLRRPWLNERCAGIILLIVVVTVAGGTAFVILQTLKNVQPIAAWLCAIFISATCLASRSLQRESSRVASALQIGDLDSARHFLSYIVGRDTGQLDEPEIWRAVIETVAENTSDGIIAPLFWLTIGGPVAAIVYKAVSTLDSMVGYKNPRYLSIGWASARMDDLLNFIPARLTVFLFVIVAPLAGCSVLGALRIARRDRLKHPSPNSGHPEAAAAGALGVRLGGASSYHGVPSWKEYIGEELQPLDVTAYRGMIRLMYFATVLLAVGCAAVTYFLRGFHVPFI